MKAVVQRVASAELSVDTKTISKISKGLVCYLGIGKGDGEKQVKWLANKVAKLRIFPDENGKMNRSILNLGYEILVVSQFTLYGDIRNGYRPSFSEAEKPDLSEKLYEKFISELKASGVVKVVSGIFGANMKINQANDGPVTIIIEKKKVNM